MGISSLHLHFSSVSSATVWYLHLLSNPFLPLFPTNILRALLTALKPAAYPPVQVSKILVHSTNTAVPGFQPSLTSLHLCPMSWREACSCNQIVEVMVAESFSLPGRHSAKQIILFFPQVHAIGTKLSELYSARYSRTRIVLVHHWAENSGDRFFFSVRYRPLLQTLIMILKRDQWRTTLSNVFNIA